MRDDARLQVVGKEAVIKETDIDPRRPAELPGLEQQVEIPLMVPQPALVKIMSEEDLLPVLVDDPVEVIDSPPLRMPIILDLVLGKTRGQNVGILETHKLISR
ncbi:MAG: hypothetical protein JW724_03245 [Candidatus Altiarchaeota archaeon]|nr:hypothetical protein [Candidatus Altiarchaeota archaeon]